MLSYNCPTCQIFWTPTKIKTLVTSPEKSDTRKCVDCSTFDWPNFTKSMVYAKSLGLPTQERRRDRIAREKAEAEEAANPDNEVSDYRG